MAAEKYPLSAAEPISVTLASIDRPNRKYSYRSYFSVSLAFNPIKSRHYKVICMLKNAKDDYDIQIYSSGTCSWKVIKHSHSLPNICGSGVFWNGFFIWHNVGNSLVYFNVEKQIFAEEQMPGCLLPKSSKTSLYFGECKGHLYYVELSKHPVYLEPTILIYEQHCSTGWRAVYNIDIRRLRVLCLKKIEYNFLKNEVKVLLIDGEEAEEEYDSPKLVLQIRDKVLSFDLGDLESINEIYDTEPKLLVIQGFRIVKSFMLSGISSHLLRSDDEI
ncbi:F-box protein At5g07610-like [Papaver somniferum]|uniref:F-box protein At5g07610-like n=1 Tax=Papaver somniferum TaxID=3469 RepID=UPI000E700C09|nr:F-box protein At5g07610-like [Papaver somniferum]